MLNLQITDYKKYNLHLFSFKKKKKGIHTKKRLPDFIYTLRPGRCTLANPIHHESDGIL